MLIEIAHKVHRLDQSKINMTFKNDLIIQNDSIALYYHFKPVWDVDTKQFYLKKKLISVRNTDKYQIRQNCYEIRSLPNDVLFLIVMSIFRSKLDH